MSTVHLTPGKAWFQQAFPQGAFTGQYLSLGGNAVQAKITNRWPDNSAKLVRIAASVASVGDYAVAPSQIGPAGPPIPSTIPPLSFWVEIDGQLWHAIPEAAHVADDWDEGPFQRETRYRVPYRRYVEGVHYSQHEPHPFLWAVIDIRLFSDGGWWASVAAENTLDSSDAGPVEYESMRLYDGDDGERLRIENQWYGLTHPYMARCRLYAYSTDFTRSEVTPNVAAFSDAGLLPAYNQNIIGTDGIGHTPFSAGIHRPHEPASGGRPELAPWPSYVARSLARPGDQYQWDAVREHGDLAGGRPVHVRELDGSWALFENHHVHQLRANWPSGTPGGTEEACGEEWIPDPAHQPSFAYWAWLATGERYYAEELFVNGQSALMLSHLPARADYNEEGPTGWLHATTEMRSWWAVMRAAEAVAALPTGWPGVDSLKVFVQANCAWLDWVSGPPGYSPLGTGPHWWRPEWNNPGYETFAPVAPWEVQYAFISVCWARKWLGIGEGATFVEKFGQTLAAVGNDPQYRSDGGFPYIWVVGERPSGGPPESVTFYQNVASAYPGSIIPFEGPGYRLALQAAVEESVPGAGTALAWLDTQGYVTFDRLQRPGWDYTL